MSEEKTSLADAIHRARGFMVYHFPFYGYLAMSTMWFEDARQKTCELSPTQNNAVQVNAEWFTELNFKQQVATVAHVTSHMAWEHLYRRGRRKKEIWQQACDLVVDYMLAKANLHIDGAAYPPSDVDLENASVESVYQQLLKHQNKKQRQPQSSCNNSIVGNDLPQENPKPPKPDKQNDDQQNDQKRSHSNTNDHGENGGSGQENGTQHVTKRNNNVPWQRKLQEAAQHAMASGQGDLPSDLERQLDELNRPFCNWWNWIQQSVSTQDYKLTYARPNRVHAIRDVYVPSRKPRYQEIVMVIDTSGSMSMEELSLRIAETRYLVQQMNVGIRLIGCDAAVHMDIRLDPGDEVPLTIGGGGGTNFIPAFELVAKDPIPPPILVYHTDGWGTYPDDKWPWQTLWVLTEHHHRPPFGALALFESMEVAIGETL